VLAGPHFCLTGCRVGDEVFIATGAMVFNGAQMGRASSPARWGSICASREILRGVAQLSLDMQTAAAVRLAPTI
jgi:carbonic anhydrase/acetyltransferase-like protein (isoleucine patch superfamily)